MVQRERVCIAAASGLNPAGMLRGVLGHLSKENHP